MTSIDNMFDWILEDIFTLLPRHDRLTCKEVCKRWYDILMERITFKEDRHIYIKTSKIVAGEAPMNVLMQTRKPYQIYTIDDDSDKKSTDYLHFFAYIGATIEEVNYKKNGDCYDIFATMPNLKALKMMDTGLSAASSIFARIKGIKPNFNFRHLERLHIGGEESGYFFFSYSISSIDHIKEFLPHNCRIIFSHVIVNVFSSSQIDDLCRIMEIAEIIKISVGEVNGKEIQKLLEVKNTDIEEFALKFEPEQNPYSFVQALQNKHRKLKGINLSCSFLPPVEIEWPKITSLTLSLHFSSLQSLEHLPNLEHLNLKPLMDECGFDHEPLSLPTLKKLELRAKSLCIECKRSLANSFENLEDVTISGIDKWNEFRKLINTWKNLTTVNIEEIGVIIYEEESLVLKPRNCIRSLGFIGIYKFQLKDVKKISESFPNLEEMRLVIYDALPAPSIPDIIKAMVKACPKLNSFNFLVDDILSNKRKLWFFRDVCDCLKKIKFPLENCEEAEDTFLGCELVTITFNRQKKTSHIKAP